MDAQKQRYNTKQEGLLIAFFEDNKEKHFTADEVWANMMPHGVSRATVYRRLERFVEDGILVKFNFGNGVGACYQLCSDLKCSNVFHFVCTKCKSVEHLDCAVLSQIQSHLNEDHGLFFDNTRTVFYGVCGRCR